jgi:hypothetical protein
MLPYVVIVHGMLPIVVRIYYELVAASCHEEDKMVRGNIPNARTRDRVDKSIQQIKLDQFVHV